MQQNGKMNIVDIITLPYLLWNPKIQYYDQLFGSVQVQKSDFHKDLLVQQ
jgi:hypothetical protein